ncbi:ribosome biogenesis GTPase Der [soil metagenome]
MQPELEGRLPVVAVVGRPNVGKSSLVNRVLGRREAIVEETPGVTRDRRGAEAEWRGRTFEIVDTGGLEPGQQGLEADVAGQAQIAMSAADLIVLVVDASVGPMEDDAVLAGALRRSGRPVLVAANKIDDPRDEAAATVFYGLGLGRPMPLSALHGRGSGDFLDAVLERLPTQATSTPSPAWAGLAIVGRPNVGKSSMLNALLGRQRALVAPSPGTTRDPVDSVLGLPDGRVLRLVDTAGMRRQVRIQDPIEYFSFLRSRQTLGRADAALLVVDAAEGITGHDQRIAEEIVEAGKACVIALNKWDAVPADERDRARLERDMAQRLRFLPWATRVRTSALSTRGIERLLPAVESAIASHRRRLPTARLNALVHDAQARRPHPRSGGRALRVLYAVQARVAPPTITMFTNGRLESSYVRYLEHRIRDVEPFAGSPLKVEVRPKG